MSATTAFKFGEYTMRPATAEDADLAAQFIATDTHHDGKSVPAYWLEEGSGVDCYVLEDASGPVLFFRMERTARGFAQFGAGTTPDEKDRNRRALLSATQWLLGGLAVNGVREFDVETENPELRLFFERELDFVPAPKRLIRRPGTVRITKDLHK